MARLLLLLPLVACALPPEEDGGEETGDTGDTVEAPCPGADCQDLLVIDVLDAAGTPADGLRGTAIVWPTGDEGGPVDPEELAFDCTGEAPVATWPADCTASTISIHRYGPTVELWVEDADASQPYAGAIEPAWVDPYGSEECGHYCWQAEATIQLEPCADC